MNEGWKNENENAYEEVTINMLSGDLICEDDINGMVGRSREAYDFARQDLTDMTRQCIGGRTSMLIYLKIHY